jgi:phage terminase small subunit
MSDFASKPWSQKTSPTEACSCGANACPPTSRISEPNAMTGDPRGAAIPSPRQKRFVEEYLVDLNATQAAIRAGYSPKTAEAQCSRLLSHVKVQRAIEARMAERSKRTEVTADRVLLEIARLGFSDLRRLFDEDGRLKRPDEWDDDTAASIASIEIVSRSLGDGVVEYVRKIKLWDKGKALDQLRKHLGLYRDQGPSKRSHLGLYRDQEASKRSGDRPLSDMSDAELIESIMDKWARFGPLIEGEARRLRGD